MNPARNTLTRPARRVSAGFTPRPSIPTSRPALSPGTARVLLHDNSAYCSECGSTSLQAIKETRTVFAVNGADLFSSDLPSKWLREDQARQEVSMQIVCARCNVALGTRNNDMPIAPEALVPR